MEKDQAFNLSELVVDSLWEKHDELYLWRVHLFLYLIKE